MSGARVRLEAPLRLRFRRLTLLMVAVVALAEEPAAAQCAVSFPQQFPLPRTYYPKFTYGYTDDLSVFGPPGARRLLMRESFGFTLWDLGFPGAPRRIRSVDLEARPGYGVVGDAFQTVSKVAAAADGSRFLVNWRQDTHGNLLLQTDDSFANAGEYGPARASGGIAIGKVGNRYLAFSMSAFAVQVADVTSFVTGAAAAMPGSIPSEVLNGAPTGSGPVIAGDYLVYTANAGGVVVVNISNPGPVGSISSSFAVGIASGIDLGFTRNAALYNASAAIVGTRLYIFAAAREPDFFGIDDGLGMAFTDNGMTFTLVGPAYHPGPSYLPSPPSPSHSASAVVPLDDDVLAVTWTRSTSNQNKLFTFSAKGWGTDLTPGALFDPALFPDPTPNSDSGTLFPSAVQTRAFNEGHIVYLYLATTRAAYELQLNCLSGQVDLGIDGRFRANVTWSSPYQPLSGQGTGVAITRDTGTFWFFEPDNVELAVKVVDGRSVNGKFWVFVASLTDVGYTLSILDRETGAGKSYANAPRTQSSFADLDAF